MRNFILGLVEDQFLDEGSGAPEPFYFLDRKSGTVVRLDILIPIQSTTKGMQGVKDAKGRSE